MNYYPYYGMPYASMTSAPAKVGLFARLFGGKGITFSGILGGAQKALNLANQAIPMIKQVSPVVKNAKTMFKVMNEFKKVDTKSTSNNSKTSNNSNNVNNQNNNTNTETIESVEGGPNFFI